MPVLERAGLLEDHQRVQRERAELVATLDRAGASVA